MTLLNIRQTYQTTLAQHYDKAEIDNITWWVLEKVLQKSKLFLMTEPTFLLNKTQTTTLLNYLKRLATQEPIQYILAEAYFFDFTLFVDFNVLIPRPETEELVDWVIQTYQNYPTTHPQNPLRIVDMGTGSGCIALALKKHLPFAEVYALDVSQGALTVAKKNAITLGLDINFLHLDLLNPAHQAKLQDITFDVIVSNPPYITPLEKHQMKANVLAHEPHEALFVPNNEPLLFYETIADFALAQEKNTTSDSPTIFVETNAHYGIQTKALFENKGFKQVILQKDLSGKERMVQASNAK